MYHFLEPLPYSLCFHPPRCGRDGHAGSGARYSNFDQISRSLLGATSQSIVDHLSAEGKVRADYWHSSCAADAGCPPAPAAGNDRHFSGRRRSYRDRVLVPACICRASCTYPSLPVLAKRHRHARASALLPCGTSVTPCVGIRSGARPRFKELDE